MVSPIVSNDQPKKGRMKERKKEPYAFYPKLSQMLLDITNQQKRRLHQIVIIIKVEATVNFISSWYIVYTIYMVEWTALITKWKVCQNPETKTSKMFNKNNVAVKRTKKTKCESICSHFTFFILFHRFEKFFAWFSSLFVLFATQPIAIVSSSVVKCLNGCCSRNR